MLQEHNKGFHKFVFVFVQDIETVRDGLNKLNKKIDLRPVTDETDKKTELTNKLYTDLGNTESQINHEYMYVWVRFTKRQFIKYLDYMNE